MATTGIVFDDHNLNLIRNAHNVNNMESHVYYILHSPNFLINIGWCGVMVARNVVVNILAHDKPVPIPVRFRAPPNRTLKLVQFQCRGLFFFIFLLFCTSRFLKGRIIHDESEWTRRYV